MQEIPLTNLQQRQAEKNQREWEQEGSNRPMEKLKWERDMEKMKPEMERFTSTNINSDTYEVDRNINDDKWTEEKWIQYRNKNFGDETINSFIRDDISVIEPKWRQNLSSKRTENFAFDDVDARDRRVNRRYDVEERTERENEYDDDYLTDEKWEMEQKKQEKLSEIERRKHDYKWEMERRRRDRRYHDFMMDKYYYDNYELDALPLRQFSPIMDNMDFRMTDSFYYQTKDPSFYRRSPQHMFSYSQPMRTEMKDMPKKEMQKMRELREKSWMADEQSCENRMTRFEVVAMLLYAKKCKNITFSEIAKRIKQNEIYTTAALMGEQSLSREEAATVCEILDINKKYKMDVMNVLMEAHMKGISSANHYGVSHDPNIYQWFEIMQIYGEPLKLLMNEKFGGDGAMNVVEMKMCVNKKSNNRVEVTISAPYRFFQPKD